MSGHPYPAVAASCSQNRIFYPYLSMDVFLEKGFTYFDTAYTYHGYRAEEAVGEHASAKE